MTTLKKVITDSVCTAWISMAPASPTFSVTAPRPFLINGTCTSARLSATNWLHYQYFRNNTRLMYIVTLYTTGVVVCTYVKINQYHSRNIHVIFEIRHNIN